MKNKYIYLNNLTPKYPPPEATHFLRRPLKPQHARTILSGHTFAHSCEMEAFNDSKFE